MECFRTVPFFAGVLACFFLILVVVVGLVSFAAGLDQSTSYEGAFPYEGGDWDWEKQTCEVRLNDQQECVIKPQRQCPSSNQPFCGPGFDANMTNVTTCYFAEEKCLVAYALPDKSTNIPYLSGVMMLVASFLLAAPVAVAAHCNVCTTHGATRSVLLAISVGGLFVGGVTSAGINVWIVMLAKSRDSDHRAWDGRAETVCTVLTNPTDSTGTVVMDTGFGYFDVKTDACPLVRYFGSDEHNNGTFSAGKQFYCHVKRDCSEVKASELVPTASDAELPWNVAICCLFASISVMCFSLVWLTRGGVITDLSHMRDDEDDGGSSPAAYREPAYFRRPSSDYGDDWKVSLDRPDLDGCPAPSHMQCPISLQLMADPVDCSCEPHPHTFERACLERALRKKQECPLSREPMAVDDIKPNDALRGEIESHIASWKAEQEREKEQDGGSSNRSGSNTSARGAPEEDLGSSITSIVSVEQPSPEGGRVAEGRRGDGAAAGDEEMRVVVGGEEQSR